MSIFGVYGLSMTPKAYCKLHRLSGGAFARRVGISETYAWRLLTKQRRVSAATAIKIEKKTKGGVDRYALRPDIFGRRPVAAAPDTSPDTIAKVSLPSQPEQRENANG